MGQSNALNRGRWIFGKDSAAKARMGLTDFRVQLVTRFQTGTRPQVKEVSQPRQLAAREFFFKVIFGIGFRKRGSLQDDTSSGKMAENSELAALGLNPIAKEEAVVQAGRGSDDATIKSHKVGDFRVLGANEVIAADSESQKPHVLLTCPRQNL